MMVTIDAKTLTFAELQAEVGEWSRRNFPNNTPDSPFYGLVEETGELAHAILKGKQGIRGTKEEHEAAEKDAVGDIVIYLADWCERSKINLAFEVHCAFSETYGQCLEDDDYSISHLEDRTALYIEDRDCYSAHVAFRDLAGSVGHLAVTLSEHYASSIAVDLAAYCHRRGFSLASIVAETWEQVRQRDWTTNKVDGQTG